MPKSRTVITILTWNRLDWTKLTLSSVLDHNKENMRDIIFMDNGSTDDTVSWLKKEGYSVLEHKKNEGIFLGTRKIWLEAVKLGYDFILNLQNDFPCMAKIPFDDIEKYLDENKDVGFVRLNEKKRKPKRNVNKLTGKPLKFKDFVKCGKTEFSKHNHHFSFNPNMFRTNIVDHLVNPIDKTRERQVMEKFHTLNLCAAKIKDPCPCFKTVIRPRVDGWIH